MERNAEEDKAGRADEEFKKKLGNIIFSTIRWCDDLGYSPEDCIKLVIESQKKFSETDTRKS